MIIYSLEGLQVSRRRGTINSLRGPCFIDSFNIFLETCIYTHYLHMCVLIYINNFYKYTFYMDKHTIYSLSYVYICKVLLGEAETPK